MGDRARHLGVRLIRHASDRAIDGIYGAPSGCAIVLDTEAIVLWQGDRGRQVGVRLFGAA